MKNARSALRYAAMLYICSPKAGVGYRLTLRSAAAPIGEIGGETLDELLPQFVDAKTLAEMKAFADDWQPMTPAQIHLHDERAHA